MGFRAEKTVRGAVLQPYIKKESGRSTWLKAARERSGVRGRVGPKALFNSPRMPEATITTVVE